MREIPFEQLKKLLADDGLVPVAEIDAAAKEAVRLGQTVVAQLVGRGALTLDYFYTLLAKFLGVPRANLSLRTIDENILRLLPEEVAHDKQALVFGRDENGRLNVAMADPADLQTIDFLKRYLKGEVVIFLASEDDLNRGFRLYSRKSAEDFKAIILQNVQASLQRARADGQGAAAEMPIVSTMDSLLSYAVLSRASDIHLEALERELVVRFRVDGILHEIIRLPKEVQAAIIARVKVLSNLKLDEHAKPQDGRFRANINGVLIDARISILPTLYGEKAVMRLLPISQRPFSLEEIGLLDETLEAVKKNLKKSYGMLLITGPTGSGKTTTLYAMMNLLNRPEVNISTVEDPIEYGIPNVNQTQVNPDAGLTFASGLRALVRQDPNVLMIGEIRDRDTADIAVQSALTGALVLSTLHTNNAATAIPRLLDIGVLPFLASAVLNVVIAQRLVRRICLDCVVSYKPGPEIVEAIKAQFEALNLVSQFRAPKSLYRGEGCVSCGNLGYRGRVGIYEALEVTEAVQRYIVSPDFTLSGLEKLARDEGMVTMFEDGLRKAERGLTTIEEVLRVIRE